MARTKSTVTQNTGQNMRPAIGIEAREQQMISLAMDLVEQRLRDGTASSQETTHFLKAASPRHQLELEKLRKENEMLKAKTESLQSQKRSEELFAEAIKAMRNYAGQGDQDEYYED